MALNTRALASAKSLPNEISALAYGVVADGVTDDSTGLRNAIVAAFQAGKTLVLPAGTIYAPTMVNTALTGGTTLSVRGQGKTISKVVGGTTKFFAQLTGGMNLKLRDLWMDTWSAGVKLASNSGGSAYGIIDTQDCQFTNIVSAPVTDISTPATGGINEFRFVNNTCDGIAQSNNDGGGVRIESDKVYSAYVALNQISNVGGASYTGKKAGIIFEAVSNDALSGLVIFGNRVYNVQNSSTAHCSGITALGPRTRIVDNWISTVQSASASNVDTYGIYNKSSYSTITGNTLINAGGNAATIMSKGYPNDVNGASNSNNNDNVIAHNTLIITTRWALTVYCGISVYNSGMDIHDNIIEGYNIGMTPVAAAYAENRRHFIHHNKVKGCVGTSGQTVSGIESTTPYNLVIEFNEFDGVGTGVETGARGINITQAANTTARGVMIRGNIIRTVSAATASNARGIAIDLNATGGVTTDVIIEDNRVDTAGRAIYINYNGTVAGFHILRNHARDCSVAAFAWGNTPPATGMFDGNTVDGAAYPALISADVGNAAKTLTPRTSEPTQRWATALGADRAVTLTTTGARTGEEFRIVREATATGAFNLNVGTGPLKALTAGQWCVVQFDGSAYRLMAFGSL